MEHKTTVTSKSGKKPTHKAKSNQKSDLSKKSVLLVVSITALIILIIFAASAVFASPENSLPAQDGNSNGSITGTVSDKGGFPLSFPSGIDNVATTNSTIYISSRNTVTCYDYSGRRNKEHTFNYVSPMIKTGNDYAVVYDAQGSKFSVLYKDKLIFEGKNDDGEFINSAYVCAEGNFLIASRSSKASGMLTYYTKSGEILFKWLCANEYLVNCAVSENGENIICSGIGAKSGEIYTKVYYFDIDKKENNKEYALNGAVCIDSFFDGNKKVIAVCQDRRALIDFSKEKPTADIKEYSSTVLKQASDSLGNTAIVQKKEDSFDKTHLCVYDSHNSISYEYDLPEDIRDICLYSSKVYVLTNDAIYKADRKLTELVSLSSINNSIVSGKRKIYYYTSSVLNRLD